MDSPLSLRSAWLAASLAAAALATAIEPRAVSSPSFVSVPIEHKSSVVPIIKRADTSAPLYNISAISYLIQMSVGTPGQLVKVAIDTGSDELWVNPQCSNVSDPGEKEECVTDGAYVPGNSQTSMKSASTSVIPYGKGEVTIQYFQDNITLPDSTISLSKVIFGVALKSKDLNEGIMGLGYGKGVNLQYSNFVDDLNDQNVTQSRAFTVALGSVDASNGGIIIFGGVDTKKFSGRLAQLPILGPQGKETIRRYWVQLASIGSTVSGQQTTYPSSAMPIVLDSGSSLSYLPSAVVKKMANDTGAKYVSNGGIYEVSCSLLTSSSSFDFTFGGAPGQAGTGRISVPFREFIWEASPGQCVLGAVPTDGGGTTALLGDTFLRSAYVVFDQTADNIYMAPYVNCGQNEQVIPATPVDAVANFSGECAAPNGTTQKENSAGRTVGEPGTVAALWIGSAIAFAVVQVLAVSL